MFAEYDAGHREILDQDHVRCDVWDVPAGKSDDEDAALPSDAAHTLLEGSSADRVEDDVDTLAVRQGAHPIPQILDTVVDCLVGAVLPGNGELLCTARSRE